MRPAKEGNLLENADNRFFYETWILPVPHAVRLPGFLQRAGCMHQEFFSVSNE